MTPFRNFSKRPVQSLKKGLVLTTIAGTLLFTSCGSNVEYVEEEVVEMTKGVVTTVEEVSPDEFKIIDEQVIEDKDASMVIANYIDGETDTMSLAEVQGDWSGGSGSFDSNGEATSPTANTTSQDTTRHYRRRSGIGSIIMYGYIGYMMGRTTRPNPAAYRNANTYNRVANTTGNTLNNTATRKTVSKPATGKSGYGSSKSTRSYGG